MASAPSLRVIARLDIKGPNVVKGVHLEGLRVVGNPAELARRYYDEGADELLYMDIVASLYGRNSLLDIVTRAAGSIFIPLTVGGGIRSIEDIGAMLRAGADKVAINTAAIKNPQFIAEASRRFGSQCIVVSIEAKRREPGRWEALTDNGRETTGRDVFAWAQEAVTLGAGEILLTSVDQEGTNKGYDLDLISAVSQASSIPVIAAGGAGSPAHVVQAVNAGHADAVAMAGILHYRRHTIADLKNELSQQGIHVRPVEAAAHG